MAKKPSEGLSKMAKRRLVKRARKGEDIFGKGKNFKKIAVGAAKKYGSEERGRKVAAAIMWRKAKRK